MVGVGGLMFWRNGVSRCSGLLVLWTIWMSRRVCRMVRLVGWKRLGRRRLIGLVGCVGRSLVPILRMCLDPCRLRLTLFGLICRRV